MRRLVQGYAISDDDPETDAREFFDPKTKASASVRLRRDIENRFNAWWDTWIEPKLREAEKG